jgi:hypothetical protein
VSSNVHTALSRNDWQLDLVHHLPSQSLQGDPNIDDPVNDTGLGLRRGDLQVSLERRRPGQRMVVKHGHCEKPLGTNAVIPGSTRNK